MSLEALIKTGALLALGYGVYRIVTDGQVIASDGVFPDDTMSDDPFGLNSLFTPMPDTTTNYSAPLVGANSLDAYGAAFIKANEGLRLKAYPDGAGYSIGYGHHITGSDGLNSNSTISQSTAEALFASDVAIASNAVRNAVSVPLTQGQFNALVDFTFNRGTGNLARSGVASALNSGNAAQARQIIASFDGGALASRRAADANMMG